MAFAGELFDDCSNTIKTYGQDVRFRFFLGSQAITGYDDDIVLTRTGTDIWVSGMVQPIGRSEFQLVQQGLLRTDDLKVYVDGSVNVSGTFKLGIGGSPPATEYSLAENNSVDSPFVNGSIIYKKLFVRRLTTGSLIGE